MSAASFNPIFGDEAAYEIGLRDAHETITTLRSEGRDEAAAAAARGMITGCVAFLSTHDNRAAFAGFMAVASAIGIECIDLKRGGFA